MSNRDLAISIVKELPEDKIEAFLLLFADENTLARIETEAIASSPDRKHYSSFKEIAKEIIT